MGTLHVETAADRGFGEWLAADAGDFRLDIATKMQAGQWYALVPQFDITGAGETQVEAVRDALDLMFAYLRAYYEDGAHFDDALRPIPRKLRLRIGVESALGHLLRELSVRTPLATESRYALPPGTLPDLAHC